MKLDRYDLNAVLTGLRLLQRTLNTSRLTPDLFAILTDGNAPEDSNHVSAVDIEDLCTMLRAPDPDPPAGFRITRVCSAGNPTIRADYFGICTAPACGQKHFYQVHQVDENGKNPVWISDHVDQDSAHTAAAGYAEAVWDPVCIDCGRPIAPGEQSMLRNHGRLSHLEPCKKQNQ